MSYKIKYTSEAIAEINSGFNWYNSKELELGQKFRDAFNTIRLEIKENPKIFKKIGKNYRRAILGSSFPYTVHFLINDKTNTIKVIGVFHQSRAIDLVKEKIKIREIHQRRQEKDRTFEQRHKQLEQIRKRQELEQTKDRDLGLEL